MYRVTEITQPFSRVVTFTVSDPYDEGAFIFQGSYESCKDFAFLMNKAKEERMSCSTISIFDGKM